MGMSNQTEEKELFHAVSLSGGKDSTAMLLLMIERGLPIHAVLTADTGMEFPEMYEHLQKLDDYLFAERGLHLTWLRHPKGFEWLMFEEKKQRPASIENRQRLGVSLYGNGWPGPRVRWCTGQLKTHLIHKEINRLKGQYKAVSYVGIAADEPKRIKNERYPLMDWGITEKEALRICYDRGYDFGGLYQIYRRCSCWCCPLQGIGELRKLRQHHPELVKVFDTVVEDGKERPVLNVKETAIAQDRQELIKSKFADWLWQDIDRRERLCRIYNDTFNSIRPREYDGSHLRFVGMNPEITLRKHQVNAIAHVIYGGNTLLAHEVGAGKTYEIVAAAMEMKRLGLCTKSLVVVPNHITEQWAAEWLQLYPAANILVATERDFEKHNRRRLCARIATGDYDAVIIGHSQLMKIPLSRERQREILQRQINEVLLAISDAKRQRAENFTIKQMERTRKSLETRLEKLNDQSTKDDTVTFEELGIDRLFIDESHNFKNLFLMTKMRNVGGIAQTEAQKSSDLFAKCQYLDELTNSHGVIFATGTPISNSMVELYTIQRYLQYGTLQEMGLVHFDDWASDFGETVTAIELAPEGYTLVGR